MDQWLAVVTLVIWLFRDCALCGGVKAVMLHGVVMDGKRIGANWTKALWRGWDDTYLLQPLLPYFWGECGATEDKELNEFLLKGAITLFYAIVRW